MGLPLDPGLHDLADGVERGERLANHQATAPCASPAYLNALGFAMRGGQSVPAKGLVDSDLVGSWKRTVRNGINPSTKIVAIINQFSPQMPVSNASLPSKLSTELGVLSHTHTHSLKTLCV